MRPKSAGNRKAMACCDGVPSHAMSSLEKRFVRKRNIEEIKLNRSLVFPAVRD